MSAGVVAADVSIGSSINSAAGDGGSYNIFE